MAEAVVVSGRKVGRPWHQGGKQDLQERGLDLSQCVHPGTPECRPLSDEEQSIIAEPFLEQLVIILD